MTGASQSSRIDGLDLLRALAALMVLVCHVMNMSGLLPGGLALWLGQTGRRLFLVLSGFLLFLPYARAASGRGRRVDPAAYALKRVLRLLPLYVGAVLVLALIGVFRSWPDNAKNLVYHLLFIHIYDPATFGGLSGPLWFIGVIAHWYVLLPFIGWAWLKLRHRLAVFTGLTLALIAAHAVVWTIHPLSRTAFLMFINKSFLGALPFLFAGATGAAYFVRARMHGRPLPRAFRTAFSLPVAVVLLASLVVFGATWGTYAGPLVLAVVAMAFAFAAVQGRALQPVRAFGRMSYSVYICHTPVLIVVLRILQQSAAFQAIDHAWLKAAVLFVAALGPILLVSMASYRLLERPFMHLKPAAPRRALARLAAAYASLVLITTAIYALSLAQPGSRTARRIQEPRIDTPPTEAAAIHPR